MDRIVLFWFLSLLTASFCYWMPTTNAEEKERQQDVSRLLDDLSDGEKQFVGLKKDVSGDSDEDQAPNRRRKQFTARKNGLRLLMAILNQIEAESTQKKRGCQFNLGGHCSTESAAFLADRWHYLDSSLSPGRKRSPQADGLTRKLIQGKLFTDNE